VRPAFDFAHEFALSPPPRWVHAASILSARPPLSTIPDTASETVGRFVGDTLAGPCAHRGIVRHLGIPRDLDRRRIGIGQYAPFCSPRSAEGPLCLAIETDAHIADRQFSANNRTFSANEALGRELTAMGAPTGNGKHGPAEAAAEQVGKRWAEHLRAVSRRLRRLTSFLQAQSGIPADTLAGV
jgi:hypothetical protein